MDYIKISLIGLIAVIAYYLLLQWPPSSIEVPINQITSQLINTENIIINAEVDGNFPNHHPDPTVPKNMEQLINTVLENILLPLSISKESVVGKNVYNY